MARRRGYPTRTGGISWGEALRQVRRAFLVLLMPVVVLGGMVWGIFTATEAGAIAVVYALAIGIFVTGELKIRELPGALIRAGITTSVVMLLIALASGVTFLLTVSQVPAALARAITGFSRNPTVFLTLVMVLLVIVGMLLESNAAYIMLVPIFHPIAVQLRIDPLHFGFVFVFNLVIGMLTPPVGVVLFVICGLAGMSVERLVRAAWPFILLQFAVLFVCVYFPRTYMWFPRLFGY
jgi:TRAP-type transport system large permease protein